MDNEEVGRALYPPYARQYSHKWSEVGSIPQFGTKQAGDIL